MDDADRDAVLLKMLGIVERLAAKLDQYEELLPEPGSLRARLLSRKVSAVDHWKSGEG